MVRRMLLLTLTLSLALTACGGPARTAFVRPDQRGALLGAYVAPRTYTDAGRIAAVQGFERRLGRRLGVVMTYHPWTQPFPSPMDRWVVDQRRLLMLSWGGASTEAIRSGRYDAMIRGRARALRALGVPVLLRWRWEMNRPNLRAQIGGPAAYVAAWKHLRAIFADAGAGNVEWVWCPLARDFTGSRAPAYYPGDGQVEWLCTDAYTDRPGTPLAPVARPFLDWAAGHRKPIVIGEFGTRPGTGDQRARWLRRALSSFRANPQVKAVLTYESDNAPAGRFALAADPPALAELRTWGAKRWLNPPWADLSLGSRRTPTRPDGRRVLRDAGRPIRPLRTRAVS